VEKILVTGGAGFVGYEVARKLADSGRLVTVLDNLENGLYPNFEKLMRKLNLEEQANIQFLKRDLADPSSFEEVGTFDSAIHLAAMPGLRYSWSSPSDNIRCNVLATSRLIEALPKLQVSRFVHISTSSVYGSVATGKENSHLNPESPYGVTKLAAEGLVSTMLSRQQISHSVVRLFSVYGPGQRPDMAYRRFLASLISGKPQVIYGDGTQSRTNTYVSDAAEGIVACLENGRDATTYNLGGVTPISINEAISFMEEMVGSKLKRISAENVKGDQRETRANIAAAQFDFGFTNSTSLWDGIKAEYEWLLSNQELIERGDEFN